MNRQRVVAEDDKLAEDEARRIEQHELVKRKMHEEIRGEFARDAESVAAAEEAEVKAVGRTLKERAIHEVSETDAEILRGRRVARIAQVVDYLFYVVYGLVGLQIFLELIGAREGAGFKQFMNSITAPLLGPFRGLVADPAVGQFQFMSSYTVALVIYILVHLAVRGLLRILVIRRTAI